MSDIQPRKVTNSLVACLFLPLVLLFVSQDFLYTRLFVDVVIFCFFVIVSVFAMFKYHTRYLLLHLMVLAVFVFSVKTVPGNSLVALSFFLLLPLCENIGEYFTLNKKAFFKASAFLYWLTIAYSFLLYFFFPNWMGGNRFCGFSPSPTSFTTYLLLLFTIYLFTEGSKLRILIALLPTLFFILVSQTRISLLLLCVILCLRFFQKTVGNNLRLTFIAIVIAAMSFYPIVTLLGEKTNFTSRYEGEKDYSALTRLALFYNQLNALAKADAIELTFGNGIGSGDKVGYEHSQERMDQHNDFFTLIYEYGVPFFLVFMVLLYRFCNSPFSLAAMAIYLFAFYHNMLYNIYAYFIIFLAYYYSKNTIQNDRLKRFKS